MNRFKMKLVLLPQKKAKVHFSGDSTASPTLLFTFRTLLYSSKVMIRNKKEAYRFDKLPLGIEQTIFNLKS